MEMGISKSNMYISISWECSLLFEWRKLDSHYNLVLLVTYNIVKRWLFAIGQKVNLFFLCKPFCQRWHLVACIHCILFALQAEVNYLGQLSHQNLVKLIGYCCEDEHRLLVYEYMASGSLEKHLFRSKWLLKFWIYGAYREWSFVYSVVRNLIH